ncbi:MAG: hypothetical protein DMG10_29650, partial [Acidobacteria bacterium]
KIPLHEPFRISSGAVSEKECIVVEMRADEGVGFGEASPMGGPFYSADTPDSTWKALAEQLVPRLAGCEKLRLQDLLSVFEETPGEPFAKAGLEGAFWDAGAQHLGRPLFELLGGRRRPIPSGVAIGIYPSLEELLARVERYMREGYQRVKIKIQPGWDIGPVRAVRERFGPVPLMVDANAAYTLRDATVFEQLDRFDLMMIEQPMAADASRSMRSCSAASARRCAWTSRPSLLTRCERYFGWAAGVSSTSRFSVSAGSLTRGKCTSHACRPACPAGWARCRSSASRPPRDCISARLRTSSGPRMSRLRRAGLPTTSSIRSSP